MGPLVTRALLFGWLCGWVGLGLTRAEDVLLREGFEQGDGTSPSGWVATAGGVWEEFGRGGKRCLKISSYVETQAKGVDRILSQNDASWQGPLTSVPAGVTEITMSAWGATMFAVAQDVSYHAAVDLEFLAADKTLIAREPCVSFVRDNDLARDEFCKVLPDGLRWKYRQTSLRVPGKTAWLRVHFRFSKNPRGEAWLDDLLVTAGKVPDAGLTLSGNKETVRRGALSLRVTSPVWANLFYREEPLHFDVMVWAENADPAGPQPRERVTVPTNAALIWDVRDFEYLPLVTGRTDASPEKWQPYGGKADPGLLPPGHLMTSLVLPEALKSEIGRWMEIHVVLHDGEQPLGEASNVFGVVDPREMSPMTDESILRGRYGNAPLWEYGDPKEVFPAWKSRRTADLTQLFGYRYVYWYEVGWKTTQPMAFGALVGKPPDPVEDFRSRFQAVSAGSMYNWSQGPARTKQTVPEWAWEKDVDATGRFRLDAFKDYVTKYLQQLAARGDRLIYCPAGIERDGDAFTWQVHRAGAEAALAAFPHSKVMLYWDGYDKAGIDQLEKHGLLGPTDAYDIHSYSGVMIPLRGFKEEVAKRRGKPVTVWSTEFSYTGDNQQENRAARLIDLHLGGFEAGFDTICWFAASAGTVQGATEPVVRDIPDMPGWFNYMLFFRYLSPVASAALPARPRRDHHVPALSVFSYYNLVQATEDFREIQRLSEAGSKYNVVALHRDDFTTLAAWRQTMSGPAELALDGLGDISGTLIDTFGRHTPMRTLDGSIYLTITENPRLLVFDRRMKKVVLRELGSVLAHQQKLTKERRVAEQFTFSFPASTENSTAQAVTLPSLSRTPVTAEKSVCVRVREPDDFLGSYIPVHLNLSNPAGDLFGAFYRKVFLADPVRLEVDSVPLTASTRPEVLIRVINTTRDLCRGTLDAYHEADDVERLANFRTEVTVPAEQTATVRIPVVGTPCLSRDYPVLARLVTADGRRIEKAASVSFRACVRCRKPMEMDGSLVDWPSELTWFTLDKKAWGGGGNVRPNFRPWGTPAQVRADASVSFTTMWDSERIYFAARIQDNEWHNPAETLDKVWEGDTLYFLLYPLDVPEGESPGIPPYRDHVGVIKDGRVSIDRRMGAFPPTSGFPPGAQGAARMDKAGYTIEWFYPRNVIAPIELKPGGIFRVTVAYGDYDHIEQDGKQVPALKGYTLFFDSFTNLTSDPNFFGRIRLVE